jgi:hypothetical protein
MVRMEGGEVMRDRGCGYDREEHAGWEKCSIFL